MVNYRLARVYGTVTDRETEKPIENCSVTAYTLLWDHQGSGFTNAEGYYEIDLEGSNIIQGRLKVFHSGYEEYQDRFRSNSQNDVELDAR